MACSLCAGTCRFSLVLFLLFRLRRASRFGVGVFFSLFLPSLRCRFCRRLSLRRHLRCSIHFCWSHCGLCRIF